MLMPLHVFTRILVLLSAAGLLVCNPGTTRGEASIVVEENAGSLAHVPPSLVEELESWLDLRAPWPRRLTPPRMVFLPATDLTMLLGGSPRWGGRARGLYDAATQTIYLVSSWRSERLADVSVLLHEMIHHRQANHHWYCQAAQELPAYRLQQAWLAENDLPLTVNWIAVVLESGCTPRDIHPD